MRGTLMSATFTVCLMNLTHSATPWNLQAPSAAEEPAPKRVVRQAVDGQALLAEAEKETQVDVRLSCSHQTIQASPETSPLPGAAIASSHPAGRLLR